MSEHGVKILIPGAINENPGYRERLRNSAANVLILNGADDYGFKDSRRGSTSFPWQYMRSSML